MARPGAGAESRALRPVVMIVAFALVLAVGRPDAVSAQPSQFHAETRLVVLDVSVTDQRGTPVTGLSRASFRVYENGRPQSLALIRNDDVPVSLGLVIDDSGSMAEAAPLVEAAALAFVRASNPGDDLFVVHFADEPRVDVPITRDLSAFEAGLRRGPGIGGTALRDAVALACGYLHEHATHERRALLVISDGRDNTSNKSESDLRRVIERGGTVVHAVSIDARNGLNDRGAKELARLSDITGGTFDRVHAASDLEATVVKLVGLIRSGYTLGYTPSDRSLDGSYRHLRVVAISPRKLIARTRSGYWATPSPPHTRNPNFSSGTR